MSFKCHAASDSTQLMIYLTSTNKRSKFDQTMKFLVHNIVKTCSFIKSHLCTCIIFQVSLPFLCGLLFNYSLLFRDNWCLEFFSNKLKCFFLYLWCQHDIKTDSSQMNSYLKFNFQFSLMSKNVSISYYSGLRDYSKWEKFTQK